MCFSLLSVPRTDVRSSSDHNELVRPAVPSSWVWGTPPYHCVKLAQCLRLWLRVTGSTEHLPGEAVSMALWAWGYLRLSGCPHASHLPSILVFDLSELRSRHYGTSGVALSSSSVNWWVKLSGFLVAWRNAREKNFILSWYSPKLGEKGDLYLLCFFSDSVPKGKGAKVFCKEKLWGKGTCLRNGNNRLGNHCCHQDQHIFLF